jgi:hypothetical protein
MIVGKSEVPELSEEGDGAVRMLKNAHPEGRARL